MELDELKSRVENTLKTLLQKDSILLEKRLHECSIAFRLGLYLDEQFKDSDLNIDMEYNRDLETENPKEVMIKDEICRVRPDLIIHQRGNNHNNLLAIEIKKGNNPHRNAPDLEKLEAYRKDLQYRYGLALIFYS